MTNDATQSRPVTAGASFQRRVQDWMMECFSMEICRDTMERNHRFLEEALELVQANGCTLSEAHQLVDYVYGRDQGEINQEVGGVMVTLAALCIASDIDMHQGGETELARIMQPGVMNKIRAKQAAKPKHSPLPGPTLSPQDDGGRTLLPCDVTVKSDAFPHETITVLKGCELASLGRAVERAKEGADLEAWLRHGRIGTGRGYQAEVERARAIDAVNAASTSAQGESDGSLAEGPASATVDAAAVGMPNGPATATTLPRAERKDAD